MSYELSTLPATLRYALQVPILAVLLGLAACSDSESDDGSGGNSPAEESTGTGSSGTIYATRDLVTKGFGALFAISANTGTAALSSFVPNYSERDGVYLTTAEFMIGGSRLSPQIMYGVNDCEEFDPPRRFIHRRSCVEIADPSGLAQRVLSLDTDMAKPPVMSPDGTMFVVEMEATLDSTGPRSFRLYSVTGALLDELELPRDNIGGIRYDWMPDGRVVFGLHDTEEGAFVSIASRGSLEVEQGFRVSSSADARIGKLAVNPDGAMIAYDMWDEQRLTYVLYLATEESKLVASTPASMLVARPTWSPDGRQLLVLNGDEASLSSGVLTGGGTPYLMLVDWQGETVELNAFAELNGVSEADNLIDVQVLDSSGLDAITSPGFSFRSGLWSYDSYFVWGD